MRQDGAWGWGVWCREGFPEAHLNLALEGKRWNLPIQFGFSCLDEKVILIPHTLHPPCPRDIPEDAGFQGL